VVATTTANVSGLLEQDQSTGQTVGRELTESFDELLEGNRQELESLYNRSSTSSESAADSGGNDSVAPVRERAGIKRFDKDELAETDAADWLDRHYPGEWRYDVRDRRREGNELVVLCRFELPSYGIRRTQFGLAEIDRPASPSQVTEREAEETAYRQAIDNALRWCIRML
jgi:hypothetical protein